MNREEKQMPNWRCGLHKKATNQLFFRLMNVRACIWFGSSNEEKKRQLISICLMNYFHLKWKNSLFNVKQKVFTLDFQLVFGWLWDWTEKNETLANWNHRSNIKCVKKCCLKLISGNNFWKFLFGQFFARKISGPFSISKVMELNWNQYSQLPLDFCFDKNGRTISICMLVMNKTMAFFCTKIRIDIFILHVIWMVFERENSVASNDILVDDADELYSGTECMRQCFYNYEFHKHKFASNKSVFWSKYLLLQL